MLNRIKSRRGFSLIELAVVLIVIGVIAAIAIPTFQAVIERSEKKALESSADAYKRNVDALAAFNTPPSLSSADLTAAANESVGVTVSALDDNGTAGDLSDDFVTISRGKYQVKVTVGDGSERAVVGAVEEIPEED